VTVTGDTATAIVRTVESFVFSDAPGVWESFEEQQYRMLLARVNNEWRIVTLDAAATAGAA
jgi:hypothetical protein